MPDQPSIFDIVPHLGDLLVLLTTLGLIGLLVYFFKARPHPTGFVIHVDEHNISFSGNFPPRFEQLVIDFLRNDVAIPGTFQVRGHWEDRVLIVVVKGETAKPLEQRIRNFLKLNLKPK